MNRLTKQQSGALILDGYDGFTKSLMLHKLYALENLLEKYQIEDLAELEIALDYYYHRYDKVETRRVEDDE